MPDARSPDVTPPERAEPPAPGAADRRRPRTLGSGNPRLTAAQYVARHRLEPFQQALGGLARGVFGEGATVVGHLRRAGARQVLTFVVDAACPDAGRDYAAFLPMERMFWTAYAHVPKPDLPIGVAVRPARGWCRAEALAPFFVHLPVADELA